MMMLAVAAGAAPAGEWRDLSGQAGHSGGAGSAVYGGEQLFKFRQVVQGVSEQFHGSSSWRTKWFGDAESPRSHGEGGDGRRYDQNHALGAGR